MRYKCCKRCEEIKPITEYYAAGKSFQSRCKPCHIIHRRENRQKLKTPKKTPFQKLPIETQKGILKYLDTMTMPRLAEKFDLNPHTLHSWKRRGHLHL